MLHDELLKHLSFVQDELQAIRVEVEGVYSDWTMHNRTLTFNPTSLRSSDAHHIDVRKPDTYDGNRNATVMDNFFFELRHYFDTVDVRDETLKVSITPIFLQDTTQLWWHRKHGKVGKGIYAINTWIDFQCEL